MVTEDTPHGTVQVYCTLFELIVPLVFLVLTAPTKPQGLVVHCPHPIKFIENNAAKNNK
jgi:hypothetical protein